MLLVSEQHANKSGELTRHCKHRAEQFVIREEKASVSYCRHRRAGEEGAVEGNTSASSDFSRTLPLPLHSDLPKTTNGLLDGDVTGGADLLLRRGLGGLGSRGGGVGLLRLGGDGLGLRLGGVDLALLVAEAGRGGEASDSGAGGGHGC